MNIPSNYEKHKPIVTVFCSPASGEVDENRSKYLQIGKACLQKTKRPCFSGSNWKNRAFHRFGKNRLTKKRQSFDCLFGARGGT